METKSMESKIRGMIYGQALGDAVGLITEFKFKRDRPEIRFPYTESIRNFPVCDWTDDTDQMILIMDTLIESECDLRLFAKKIIDWKNSGFPELGDTCGSGLGGTTNMVLINDKWLDTDLFAASKDTWEKSGHALAPNGAIMRTCILSILRNESNFVNIISDFCKITHYDIRCVLSCYTLCFILAHILDDEIDCKKQVFNLVVKLAKKHIDQFPHAMGKHAARGTPRMYAENEYIVDGTYDYIRELKKYFTSSLSKLELDEIGKIGYTYKCMGCAVWALDIITLHKERGSGALSFKKVITRVVEECGDADTNASVVGAVLGAYLGYEGLPSDWLEALPNKEWLDKKIDMLLDKFIRTNPQKTCSNHYC
jgi:ADP-ribosylglycohydrolase